MIEEREKSSVQDSVAKFYDGKTIFITGAAGFVGVVLLEILLRCCSGIKGIYILLREKKGITPKDRREELFQKPIFSKLREENPGVFDKVHVVPGDICLPQLGMCEKDLLEVLENVTVVFHCAASISFVKSLKYLLTHNTGGVANVIEMCKRLKRCEVLVYTSTAYSNCNRKLKIEERVYKLPYTTDRFMDAVRKDDDKMLTQLVSECKPEWPNCYTFSKCLAENLVSEKASGIPTAIVRPAVVSHIWKGVLQGYVEENSSFAQILIGMGKGFIKVMYMDPRACLDFVPVDVVANAHIISAWAVATGRSPLPFVVNCTSEGSYHCGIVDHAGIVTEMCTKNPLPNTFRRPDGCSFTTYPIKIKMLRIIEHYIPALGIDLILYLKGRKPRAYSFYRFFDKTSTIIAYFVSNIWEYENDNFKSLQQMVNSEDNKVFYTDLDGLDIRTYASQMVDGAPFYDWKLDRKSKKERVKLATRIYYFTRFTQAFSVILFCLLLYTVLSHVVSRVLIY